MTLKEFHFAPLTADMLAVEQESEGLIKELLNLENA